MGRFATLLCVATGVATIIDHVRNNPFYSQIMARHFISDANGWRISPALNFIVLLGLGAAVWLITSSETAPAEPAAARKHAWKRSGLAAATMAAWLAFGPAIRRPPLAPQALPLVETRAPPSAMPFSPFQLKPLDRGRIGGRDEATAPGRDHQLFFRSR